MAAGTAFMVFCRRQNVKKTIAWLIEEHVPEGDFDFTIKVSDLSPPMEFMPEQDTVVHLIPKR